MANLAQKYEKYGNVKNPDQYIRAEREARKLRKKQKQGATLSGKDQKRLRKLNLDEREGGRIWEQNM